MGAKTLKPRTASLYDQDFAVWTSETARLLRAGRFDEIDIEHVAEEIEDMGKRDKRELHSRLTVLLLHLLYHSPLVLFVLPNTNPATTPATTTATTIITTLATTMATTKVSRHFSGRR